MMIVPIINSIPIKEPVDLNLFCLAVLKNQKIWPNSAKHVTNINKYPGGLFSAAGLTIIKWNIAAIYAMYTKR